MVGDDDGDAEAEEHPAQNAMRRSSTVGSGVSTVARFPQALACKVKRMQDA